MGQGARSTAQATWVPETRFGNWFQGTGIWKEYVLAEAVSELAALLGARPHHFETVLDVGCAKGQGFSLIEEHFAPRRLIGIDVDPEAISTARRVGTSTRCYADLRVADVTKPVLPSESVDLVLCHQSLHHISDQLGGLREMRRVLKPGGVLLLAESCRRFIRSLPVRALFRHPMEVQRSPAEYVELVRQAGFAVDPASVATPDPFWASPDFGLRRWMGMPARSDREPTQLRLLAFAR